MTTTPSPLGASGAQQKLGDPSLPARLMMSIGRHVGSGNLTPDALALAVADVLPVAAAGLALLVDPLRLPLGASDDDARRAEQIQTTLGAGPCLDAAGARATVVADYDLLERRWPVYVKQLCEQTPFRSVAALPLHAPGGGVIAALDLFSTQDDIVQKLDLPCIEELARPVAALLTVCLDDIHDIDTPESGPDWYRRATSRRHDVWLAIGMLMSQRATCARDALDLLRGHAYSHDDLLDELAGDLVRGHISPRDITG